MERLRQCVACRQLCPVETLIQLTHHRPSDEISLNLQPPRQGRSAYVCQNPSCLEMALKGKKLQRSLKRAIPDDILRYLVEELEGLKCRGIAKSKNL